MKPRRGNNYLEQLKRSQAAKGQQAAETPKPTSQMTEAELDAEVVRLEREVRAFKERTVELGREELAGQGSKRPKPRTALRSWPTSQPPAARTPRRWPAWRPSSPRATGGTLPWPTSWRR